VQSLRKRAYLEEIVNDEAVLTCEDAITPPRRSLNVPSDKIDMVGSCKRNVPRNPGLDPGRQQLRWTARLEDVAHVTEGPSYGSHLVLGGLVLNSPSNAHGAFSGIGNRIVEIAGEIDNESIFALTEEEPELCPPQRIATCRLLSRAYFRASETSVVSDTKATTRAGLAALADHRAIASS
jgi:hypothetical protein